MERRFCLARLFRLATVTFGIAAAAGAQQPMPELTIRLMQEGTQGQVPKLTFHNSGTVEATAWLVVVEHPSGNSKGVVGQIDWVDTAYNPVLGPIPPGGDGVASTLQLSEGAAGEYRLVGVLYADGAVQGAPNWGQVVLLARRQRFELVSTVSSQLSQAAAMTPTEALSFLENAKIASLEAARRFQAGTSAKVKQNLEGHDDIGAPFKEITREAREANLNNLEATRHINWVAGMYSTAESPFQAALKQTGDLDRMIQQAQQFLQADLHKLSQAKPALTP